MTAEKPAAEKKLVPPQEHLLFAPVEEPVAATSAEVPVIIETGTEPAEDALPPAIATQQDEAITATETEPAATDAQPPLTIVQLAEEATGQPPAYPLYEEDSLPLQDEIMEEVLVEQSIAPADNTPDAPQPAEEIVEINYSLFGKAEALPTSMKKAPTKGKRGRKSFKDIDAELALVEVPADEELFTKMYYPISVVAKWFNVNTSLLRFWENEFDILKPRKNRKGDRMFRPEDVKNLQVIYHLLRQRKFSIEGAKKYIKQNKSQVDVNLQLIQSLTKFRSFLLEIKANLGA